MKNLIVKIQRKPTLTTSNDRVKMTLPSPYYAQHLSMRKDMIIGKMKLCEGDK